jgi:hypothetical protein
MARIGGKGMSYIVKNCPSCIISPSCCAMYHIDNRHAKDCQDIKDCVIKQVIRKCRRSLEVSYCPIEQEILQLFDIEEINK